MNKPTCEICDTLDRKYRSKSIIKYEYLDEDNSICCYRCEEHPPFKDLSDYELDNGWREN